MYYSLLLLHSYSIPDDTNQSKIAFQLFEEAAEATKELKKNKKKRASSSATGSTTSASPKGETADASETTPRKKANSPIVEKVDSEVQFKVQQAAVDEAEEEEEVETAASDDEEEVVDECLVPIEITDGLKRRLEEDQVLGRRNKFFFLESHLAQQEHC